MYLKGIGFILIGVATTIADSHIGIAIAIASLGALLTMIGGRYVEM